MENSALSLKGKRALFISYNGMLDPLGQSQVIPLSEGIEPGGGAIHACLALSGRALTLVRGWRGARICGAS